MTNNHKKYIFHRRSRDFPALSDVLPEYSLIAARRLGPFWYTAAMSSANFEDLFAPQRPLHNVRFRVRKKIPGREQILARIARWFDDSNSLEAQIGETFSYKLKNLTLTSDHKTDPVTLAGDVRAAFGLQGGELIHDISICFR